MDVVGEALLHWDPLPHKDLKVRRYREFSLPPGPDAFQSMQLDPAVADDRWLLDETAKIAAGLGAPAACTSRTEETALLRQKSTEPSEAWREILRRRSEALARGGLNAVAPYGAIIPSRPAQNFEDSSPLRQRPRSISGRSSARSRSSPPASPRARQSAFGKHSRLRDHNTLQLGLFAGARKADSWQLIDCVYYPSDTYFMALDLFQLWPVDGGTLVWQVGFVSAPFRSLSRRGRSLHRGKTDDAGNARHHQSVPFRRRERALRRAART